MLWRKTSVKLCVAGYTFTEDQVSGRWKTLNRVYKDVKDGRKKSELDQLLGKDPDISPRVTLSLTASSTSSKPSDSENSSASSTASKTSGSENSTASSTSSKPSDSENSTASSTASKTSGSENSTASSTASKTGDSESDQDMPGESGKQNKKPAKRRKSQASQIVEFLETYVDRQEERHQKEVEERRMMHREKMDILKSLCSDVKR